MSAPDNPETSLGNRWEGLKEIDRAIAENRLTAYTWQKTWAEITSIDLLYAVLDRIVSEAGRSMASFIAADEAKLAIWRSQVADVRSKREASMRTKHVPCRNGSKRCGGDHTPMWSKGVW